jgi:hypothetical protein
MQIRALMSMSADGYRVRAANRGGDVHLVCGPRTIETYRALGALDTLELVVPPRCSERGCV